MVFTIPEGLHPDLNPLAWLVGTWRGKGHGEYPTIKPFQFISETVFNHDGRPFLNYFSRSWIVDDDGEIIRPGASEAGFWRIKPNNVLEVVISHNTGITEGWLGHFVQPTCGLHDHPQALGAFFKTGGFTRSSAFGKALDVTACAKGVSGTGQHHEANRWVAC